MFRHFVAPAAAAVSFSAALCCDAAATTLQTSFSQTVFASGALNATQNINVPGFSSPGSLVSVQTVFTLDTFEIALYLDSKAEGSISFAFNSAFTFTVPAPFDLVVPISLLTFSDSNFAVFVGNSGVLGGTYDSGDPPWSSTVTTNLSAFTGGPFLFTAGIASTLDTTLIDGVTLTPKVEVRGNLVVTYSYDVDGVGTPVPEPAGLALFGLGLGTVAWVRRRRTR